VILFNAAGLDAVCKNIAFSYKIMHSFLFKTALMSLKAMQVEQSCNRL
jgi:hypothetical protein